MFKTKTFLFVTTAGLVLWAPRSQAVPSFSRKYNTSCQTCHTAFPVLNGFGEAFRRNGFRFPSVGGSEDSDATSQETLPLGQEEYEKTFPYSVWPDRISLNPPLSVVVFGNANYVLPDTDLYKATSTNWTWGQLVQSVSLLAAGSFSDRLTYYLKASFSGSGARVASAYLTWNDLIGPRHLVNLSLGRLTAPQLASFSSGESYVNYQLFPAVSIAGLFNPNASYVLGHGPVDGAEVHGVAFHRIAYSFGAAAAKPQSELDVPNSEDFYMHVGAKFGGMSLDGEGSHGLDTVDPVRPWSEISLTFDTFGYRGVLLTDNGINAPAITAQRSAFQVVGHALHVNLRSLMLNAVVQYQAHHRPYPGTAPATPPNEQHPLPGVPDNHKGKGIVGSSEIAYVIYPWLIPAIRTEYTRLESHWGSASLLRVLPGATVLLRPNIRFYIVADFERADGLPPAPSGSYSWWTLASGSVQPSNPHSKKFELEQVTGVLAWAL